MKLKLLQDIIDEHFTSSYKTELVSLFDKHGVFDLISKSSEQLRVQLQRAISTDSGAPITAITTTSSNFLVSVNSQIIKIADHTEKRQIQVAIAEIGLRILLSIIKQFPSEASAIFEAVKQSLQLTSEMFGYNYSDINDLMKYEEFTDLTQSLTGKKYSDELQKIPQTEIASVIWTNKVPLGFLTTELKNRKWIKNQNEFSKLFGNSDIKLEVHWNMKFKYELAHLLYLLAKDDFIRPRKGVFSISEKFIVDFSGTKLKANSLRKISSKISTDPAKYPKIIESVEQIIKRINKKKTDF